MHSGALATVPLLMLKVWFFIVLSLKFRPPSNRPMGMTCYLNHGMDWISICTWSAPAGFPEHVFKCVFHLKGIGFISSRSTPQVKRKHTKWGELGDWLWKLAPGPSKLRHWCRYISVQVWTLLSWFLWVLCLSVQTSQQCVSKSHLLIISL